MATVEIEMVGKPGTIRVRATLARALVKMGRARYLTREASPAPVPAAPVKEKPRPRISERTGKPIRQYRRRDMKAED